MSQDNAPRFSIEVTHQRTAEATRRAVKVGNRFVFVAEGGKLTLIKKISLSRWLDTLLLAPARELDRFCALQVANDGGAGSGVPHMWLGSIDGKGTMKDERDLGRATPEKVGKLKPDKKTGKRRSVRIQPTDPDTGQALLDRGEIATWPHSVGKPISRRAKRRPGGSVGAGCGPPSAGSPSR